jgi:hypothetical protein
MTPPSNRAAAVRERFLRQNYSDCRLLTLRTERIQFENDEKLHLELQLLTGEHADQWVPATLTFSALAWAKIDVDFWAKAVCGDTIAEAICDYGDEEAAKFFADHPFRKGRQQLSDFLLFTIYLCEPSGTLKVFAKDFLLVTGEAEA